MRAVGGNPLAARYVGVNDRRSIVWAMLISGGLAGLGGAVEVLGLHHRLFPGFSPGFGFEGLIAAILASGNAIATMVFAVLIGGLRSGGEEMQRNTGAPIAFVFIIQGLIILVAAGSRTRYRRSAVPGQDSAAAHDAGPYDAKLLESPESMDA
jgi:simple sugar transport system permease protein